jgi:Ni,Fe-hydrogenase maturation factor
LPSPPILAALTHPLCGDAAVGAAVLASVTPLIDHQVWVVDGVDPTDLLDIWAEAPIVVIVETRQDGAELGTLSRVDLTEAPLAFTSGRVVGMPEVLAVARAMHRAPLRAILFGITIGRADAEDSSSAVTDSVAPASAAIVAELRPVLAGLNRRLAASA